MTPASPIRTVVDQNAEAGRALSSLDATWALGALGVACVCAGAWLAWREWTKRGMASDPGERAFRALAAHVGLDADAQRVVRALASGLGCLPAALLVCPRALEDAARRAIRRGEPLTPGQVERLVSGARVARR